MRCALLVLFVAACTETPSLPPCIDGTPCPGLDAAAEGAADASNDAGVRDATPEVRAIEKP